MWVLGPGCLVCLFIFLGPGTLVWSCSGSAAAPLGFWFWVCLGPNSWGAGWPAALAACACLRYAWHLCWYLWTLHARARGLLFLRPPLSGTIASLRQYFSKRLFPARRLKGPARSAVWVQQFPLDSSPLMGLTLGVVLQQQLGCAAVLLSYLTFMCSLQTAWEPGLEGSRFPAALLCAILACFLACKTMCAVMASDPACVSLGEAWIGGVQLPGAVLILVCTRFDAFSCAIYF